MQYCKLLYTHLRFLQCSKNESELEILSSSSLPLSEHLHVLTHSNGYREQRIGRKYLIYLKITKINEPTTKENNVLFG